MRIIPLGANAYSDNAYNLPSVVLENWFAEVAPDNPGRPYRLLPTPGLVSVLTGLPGAVRGMFQVDGLLSGDAVVAADDTVYRVTSAGVATALTGTLTKLDTARFAASQADIAMVAGGKAYTVSGTTLGLVTWVGPSGDITDIASTAQRHIYLEGGTGRFWWSDTAEPYKVQATSFATAESEPDNLLAMRVWNDTLLLFGTQTIEGWYYTGDTEFPFRRRPGYVIQRGIMGRDAITLADFGIFAVGDDGVVYRVENGQPSRTSTHQMERLIQDVASASRSSISLSSHYYDGHPFIGLHLPGVGDYFYDVATEQWHRRREISADRYLCDQFIFAWGGNYAADRVAGTIYRIDRDTFTHDGEMVRRVATGIYPIDDGRPMVPNVVIDIQPGVGAVTGDGVDPQVMFSVALDGRTYGPEAYASFGKIGEYGKQTVFSVGRLKPPVVTCKVAVTDPVGAVVNSVKADVSRP
jgi:hypothetical protein